MKQLVLILLACVSAQSQTNPEARKKYESKFTTVKSQELLSCPATPTLEFVPGQVVVQFTTSATDDEKRHVDLFLHAVKVETISPQEPNAAAGRGELKLYTFQPPDFKWLSFKEFVQRVAQQPGVVYAEPNFIYRVAREISNDPLYKMGATWGVYSDDLPVAVGPLGTTNPYGSQAEKAWARGHIGSRSVYVGIIDSGVQAVHPDLKDNIWTNPIGPSDIAASQIQSRSFGIHGWNFYDNNNDLFDSNEDPHGTHVAGIIGARGGNGIGVAGVVWYTQLIAAKFIGSTGSGTEADAVAAFKYLTELKKTQGLNIVVINCSWVGYGFSQALLDVIKDAATAGIVVVAAAGNDCNNNDAVAAYPASYDTATPLPNDPKSVFNAVLSVAAITSTGDLLPISNYGAKSVHLGAPGEAIFSTFPTDDFSVYPNGDYQTMSGTSMAAAYVSGSVALYASSHPNAYSKDIIDAIIQAARAANTPKLSGRTTTGGRLNVADF